MSVVEPTPSAAVPRWEKWRQRLRDGILLLALLALSATLAAIKPQFLTGSNLINVARQISITGPLAVGATMVLLTGGVDLSQGSVVALTGVLAAGCGHPGALILTPILAGLAAGAACGWVNGWLVTRAKVAPFIATLGMMTAARGLALVLSGGRPISDLAPGFLELAEGEWLGVPRPIVIFALTAVAAHLFLRRFRSGRYIYAVGGNEQAAFASGISIGGIKRLAYSLCGASAGLSGLVLAARTTTGQPNAGVGYELDAIAAAVIGGTSLSGGIGGIGGTVLGAVLIGVINNGLDLANVPSYYQQIVKGAIIVTAVGLDRRRHR